MATALLSLLCAAALLGLPATAAPLSFPEGQVLQLRAVAAGGSLQVLPLPQGRSLGDFAADEPAHVNYDPKFATDGWDRLTVVTNPQANDKDAAHAAGFLEGAATAQAIFNHATNTGASAQSLSPKLKAFLSTNNKWMQDQITAAASLQPNDPLHSYWNHVDLTLTQLYGLCAGYNSTSFAAKNPLACDDILLINLDGDMEDLASAVGDLNRTREERATSANHCSALIRLMPGNEDLYISQDTWSSLNSMTRIMKLYNFSYAVGDGSSDTVAGQLNVFSSYPGSLFSGDDFYLLGSGLAVIETTIGNSNPDLDKYIVPNTVLEWLRNIVSNRLASDGETWYKIYRQFNSGTYNNQNYILDFNKFTPKKALQNMTLTMVEQIPGYVILNDVSALLDTNGYWGSYNTAYDTKIRELSGENQNEKLFGDWFSYWKTPRAQIFARDAPKVKDLESMKKLMRYNDYTHDPLSTQLTTCHYLHMTNCTPAYTSENTIACRGDLNPADGVYGLSAFKQRNHVATDSKITRWSDFAKGLTVYAQSGPTYDTQPVFKWSTSPYANTSHVGMPDEVKFPWVEIAW